MQQPVIYKILLKAKPLNVKEAVTLFTAGTDITTAVTDLINAVVLTFLTYRLIRRGVKQKRDKLWITAFVLFILVSVTGFFIHGLTATDDPCINEILQRVMIVELAFMLTFFMVAMFCDVYGERVLQKALPVCLALGAVFSTVAISVMHFTSYKFGFRVFIVYCVACLLVMITVLLKHRNEHEGFDEYLWAVMILAAANYVQMIKIIKFSLIWDFNHNSVYHVILLVFALVLYTGICRYGDSLKDGQQRMSKHRRS